jgi:serine/threonine protein kinase
MANTSSQYLDDAQYEVRVAGRFKMGKKIGSGSFGEIFLAVDTHTNKEVAVKFVRLHLEIYKLNLGVEEGPQTSAY